MKKIKQIFLIFISVCIFGITIYTDYQSVKAFDIPTAFWGTLEASRAFWTALQAGGGVRGGGVSTATFEHSSREDMHELQVQVMLAYTAFCIWKEKAQLKLDHPDWSDEEINQQAEVNGRLASDRFQNSAINVTDTTKDLTIKDYGYWKEFCNSFRNISLNGLGAGDGGNMPRLLTDNNNEYGVSLAQNSVENSFSYNGYSYFDRGSVGFLDTSGNFTEVSINYSQNVPTDRVRIPFVMYGNVFYRNEVDIYIMAIDINRLTGEIITTISNQVVRRSLRNYSSFRDFIENAFAVTNLPTYLKTSDSIENRDITTFSSDYENNLSATESNNVNDYEKDIENALNNTEAGKAIKEGAENGQEEIIKSGTIPVKRSSVRTGEETATGAVGWDVPDTRTLEGAIAVPDTQDDVVEGMGVISVPEDVVRPKDDDTVAEWAKDEPISIPDTKDEPISKPIDDVISDQYGDYYPTQISLADFFPFCIPFDIYYCVQKFNVGQGEAPIIHIPIVYPRALQGALGESYDVIIDFNNYIALRNIIRAFILIFFLVGLMQLTRNLIRG